MPSAFVGTLFLVGLIILTFVRKKLIICGSLNRRLRPLHLFNLCEMRLHKEIKKKLKKKLRTKSEASFYVKFEVILHNNNQIIQIQRSSRVSKGVQ